MALEVEFTMPFSKNCGTIYWGDSTPDHSGDEEGGYGAPNPTKASITSTKITLTDSNGNNYVYSDYLPTTAELELTPDMFTPPIGTVLAEDDDDDCGCDDCDEDVVADTTLFSDKCWTVKYEVFIDDELQSSRIEDVFWDCVTMVRIISNIRANLCGTCDQKLQDALRDASQYHDEALLVYQHGGCECAGDLLDKANEILADVENDVI